MGQRFTAQLNIYLAELASLSTGEIQGIYNREVYRLTETGTCGIPFCLVWFNLDMVQHSSLERSIRRGRKVLPEIR